MTNTPHIEGKQLPPDIPGYERPAFLLLIAPQLIWPDVLVEVEVIEAKAA